MIKKIINFPFYIILISIYPSLYLLADNIEQIYSGSIVRPIFLSVILGFGFYWGSLKFFKDPNKSGTVAFFTILLFLTYGRLFSLAGSYLQWFTDLGKLSHLILIFTSFITIFLIIKIYDKTKIIDAKTLTVIGITLLIFPFYQIGEFVVGPKEIFSPAELELSVSLENQNPPDIYHIILDAYSREDYLSNSGFDNSEFLDFLRQQGFYVADCSKSNYSRTALSLASTLNLDYLWKIFPDRKALDRDDTAIYGALSNNLVHNQLRKIGYQFITTDNGYAWSQHTQYAGLLVKIPRAGVLNPYLIPFEYLFIESTSLRIITDLLNLGEFKSGYYINGGHYEQVKYSLEKLASIPQIPGPKYVYYHITVPHAPYIFSPDGNLASILPGEQGYIRNIKFINNEISSVLKKIIEDSKNPPVIILQGDHGSMLDKSYRFHILNAIYLPGDTSMLYPEISPVNSYRVIFNQIFGTNFSLLKDKSIQADIGHPFRNEPAILPDKANLCQPTALP